MTTDDFLADCRARLAFDLFSNTWNAVVLWALRDGPRRPVELRERIGGISSKVLTETLRRLMSNGLVDRRAHPGSPARVEYRLTGLGRTLLAPIDAVGAWAFAHGDEVLAAREAACTAGESGRRERCGRSESARCAGALTRVARCRTLGSVVVDSTVGRPGCSDTRHACFSHLSCS